MPNHSDIAVENMDQLDQDMDIKEGVERDPSVDYNNSLMEIRLVA